MSSASAGTIAGCTFDHNEAVGGDGNTGSGSVVLVGEGLGGAIVSGYGGNLYGPNTLTVSNSTFTQNDAQGGDNDTGTGSVAGLVGTGAGAGIANYAGGTASVSGSDLDQNQAIGGHDNTAGGTGTVFAGVGAGGGIFNSLGNYNSGYGLFNTSAVTVSNSTLQHNQAQGGGGNGEGGAIASVFAGTTIAVTGSTITDNQALGTTGPSAFGDATGGAFDLLTGTRQHQRQHDRRQPRSGR